jgi:hypothetical protein
MEISVAQWRLQSGNILEFFYLLSTEWGQGPVFKNTLKNITWIYGNISVYNTYPMEEPIVRCGCSNSAWVMREGLMIVTVVSIGIQEILCKKSEDHTVLSLKDRKISSDVHGLEVQVRNISSHSVMYEVLILFVFCIDNSLHLTMKCCKLLLSSHFRCR